MTWPSLGSCHRAHIIDQRLVRHTYIVLVSNALKVSSDSALAYSKLPVSHVYTGLYRDAGMLDFVSYLL